MIWYIHLQIFSGINFGFIHALNILNHHALYPVFPLNNSKLQYPFLDVSVSLVQK